MRENKRYSKQNSTCKILASCNKKLSNSPPAKCISYKNVIYLNPYLKRAAVVSS